MPTWGTWPDDIITDETVTAAWLTSVSQSLAFLERVAYQEFISPVSITATTEATADVVVSAGAVTYEAAPIKIEFFVPMAANVTDVSVFVALYDGTTALGEICRLRTTATGGTVTTPLNGKRILTPTAASHTYNVKAWTASGTALLSAGAGGSGALMPGYIEIRYVPT